MANRLAPEVGWLASEENPKPQAWRCLCALRPGELLSDNDGDDDDDDDGERSEARLALAMSWSAAASSAHTLGSVSSLWVARCSIPRALSQLG